MSFYKFTNIKIKILQQQIDDSELFRAVFFLHNKQEFLHRNRTVGPNRITGSWKVMLVMMTIRILNAR